MRAPGLEEAPELHLKRINGRVKGFIFALVTLDVLVMMGAYWGHWKTFGIVLALGLTATGVNLLLTRDFFAEFSEAASSRETLRVGLNLVITAGYGHFTGWIFPVWFFLPLNSLWVRHALHPRHRAYMYVMFVAITLFALFEGSPPTVSITMLLLSVLITGTSGAYLELTAHTVGGLSRRQEELAHSLTELDLTHRRAREQERLSSLGMLAAGIAHEINNPMSYVKSNLHALQHELRGQAELPPGLREYAVEVLPETLEGVQRVCSIVADLRRFAKGDPEALIPYDLNEEVQTALRITRGRLQAHCDVEVSLEPLQPMLGHPRQISQVVVNLLLNAAQAMKRRGQVFVSTRPDGEDDVVLTVRDTGEGMGPDVLAHLFQPFFTTRPEGEGTGLGLAVVHGIITSHGGRVRVESTVGEGSTFVVRLPRVPPFTFTRQEPESPAENSETSGRVSQARAH
ncbi:sensor histidine kinase [Melittangium boletus]|uniref:histidine kinase n=1 Tax=Melittangium boletus DSM 14713 TaxID=1294270 RepID=A0A250IG07_9BACT|nr:ATP-binding protein [Melittangium boletus]ATB30081.1 two-component sensor histidine kinase [Melittangium boletus DSM 14713]